MSETLNGKVLEPEFQVDDWDEDDLEAECENCNNPNWDCICD